VRLFLRLSPEGFVSWPCTPAMNACRPSCSLVWHNSCLVDRHSLCLIDTSVDFSCSFVSCAFVASTLLPTDLVCFSGCLRNRLAAFGAAGGCCGQRCRFLFACLFPRLSPGRCYCHGVDLFLRLSPVACHLCNRLFYHVLCSSSVNLVVVLLVLFSPAPSN
jgi:hypothetical protein